MAIRPVFAVTVKSNVGRMKPGNYYTGGDTKLDMFRVGLIHGHYQGLTLDFFFETRPEADRFSLWQVLAPAKIIETIGPRETFQVQEIVKTGWMSQPNMYTGARQRTDSWKVSMQGANRGQLDLRFPYEDMAWRYSLHRSYTMQDILGTIPISTSELADMRLRQYVAERRKQKQPIEDVDDAPPTPAPPAPTPPPAPPAPPPPQTPAPPQATPQWYTVTNGGRAGTYNGVGFQAGQFTYAYAVSQQATDRVAPAFQAYDYQSSGAGVNIVGPVTRANDDTRVPLQSGGYAVMSSSVYSSFGFSDFEWFGVFVGS